MTPLCGKANPTAAITTATPSSVPHLAPLDPAILCLSDYESAAQGILPPAAWAYFSGGAADERTLRANTAAWSERPLRPRVLRDLRSAHTRIELLGRTWPIPLLCAPVAFQRLAHPDGELATAVAAAAQGAGLVFSTQASLLMEPVAAAIRDDAGRGPLWFQLYWQTDRAVNLTLIQRAEACGFEAVVLTVDAPVQGSRHREGRARFTLPPDIRAVNLPCSAHPGQPAPTNADFCGGLLTHAPTWADVAWLTEHTRLPVLLKGITHPDDAAQAATLGVSGLIVSNHGGRTLDGMPPTAHLLPEVVDRVGTTLPVLVDGGIRRGTDVLTALALGARAVLLGRPLMYALSVSGAAGVAHALRLLRDELEIAMALCGCSSPAQATEGLGHRKSQET